MKKLFKWKLPATMVLLAMIFYASCSNRLNLQPQGSLIGANVGNGSGASNYVYGNEAADDAYKGSSPSDQPDAIPLLTWSLAQAGTSSYLDEKWVVLYTGIQRANDVLRTVRLSPAISSADTTEYVAEARFLRGYYHLEGKKFWNNFPYVSELISYTNNNLDVPIMW